MTINTINFLWLRVLRNSLSESHGVTQRDCTFLRALPKVLFACASPRRVTGAGDAVADSVVGDGGEDHFSVPESGYGAYASQDVITPPKFKHDVGTDYSVKPFVVDAFQAVDKRAAGKGGLASKLYNIRVGGYHPRIHREILQGSSGKWVDRVM